MQNTTKTALSYQELLQENSSLKAQIDYLTEQLNYFKRMIFGQKRERFIPASDNQLNIFGLTEAAKNLAVEKEEITYLRDKNKAKKQTPHFRNPIPDAIPRREIIIEPEGLDTTGLKRIGEEITEELEYEEAKLYVNNGSS